MVGSKSQMRRPRKKLGRLNAALPPPQQHALHATPAAAPLLAVAAASCLAVVLPLIVYCGTAAEFGAGVNPLTPAGYMIVARRTYSAAHAARGSGGRVEGKDL